ncbi:Neurexin-3 [Schistosoma japonicum]|uniref:Neurexin-3 n=1 Tax=Schistosoma japonicum TaxID=6182 RepID=A0A4Z2DJF2_SCHJA|nr:Neurexin-3 [Schistosoma japonicum]
MIIIVFISQYLLLTETRENMQRTLKVDLPNNKTEVNFQNNLSQIVESKSNIIQILMTSASSTDQHSREEEHKFPESGSTESYDRHDKSLVSLTLTTPKPTTINRIESNFITFKQSDCYLYCPAMHLYEKFRLHFTFRTSQEHGLILFNSDKQGVDFIAFELIKGYLHFVFDMGSGSQRSALTTHSVTDFYWHNVELFRNDLENNILQLYIDRNKSNEQSLKIPVSNGDIARNFNLNDPLYIGGISQYVFLKWREKLSSYHGFQGCIGNFSVNGLPSFDLLNMAKSKYPTNWTLPVCQDQIINDCHNRPKDALNCNQIENIQKNSPNNNINEINDVNGKQHQTYCLNDGLCLNSWTDVNCACELTTFDGHRCMKAGTTFVYGIDYDNLSNEINMTSKIDENIGYIRFIYTDRARNTRQDEFVLGIQTFSPNTFHNRHYYIPQTHDNYITTLLFVTSLTQVGDFIHLFLESGIVRLNYNMGGGVVHISGPNFPINDGFYHRIRGYRVDHQIILEVDDTRHTYELNSVYGKQFNNQKVIWLGHSPQLNKTDYFYGYMTGVYYNGLLLNDLAAGLSYLVYIHVTRFGNVRHLPNFQPNLIKSKYSN